MIILIFSVQNSIEAISENVSSKLSSLLNISNGHPLSPVDQEREVLRVRTLGKDRFKELAIFGSWVVLIQHLYQWLWPKSIYPLKSNIDIYPKWPCWKEDAFSKPSFFVSTLDFGEWCSSNFLLWVQPFHVYPPPISKGSPAIQLRFLKKTIQQTHLWQQLGEDSVAAEEVAPLSSGTSFHKLFALEGNAVRPTCLSH